MFFLAMSKNLSNSLQFRCAKSFCNNHFIQDYIVGVGGKMLGNADILTALKVDTSSIVHSKIKYVGFKNTSKICTLACNNHVGRSF